MPTPSKGPRLGGSPAHERLMLANLATQLFTYGKITTTETKAKRLRPYAERLITFGKRGDLHARRQVMKVIGDKTAVHVLFTEIGPAYAGRPGGYTRIIKLGPRKGDNAPMAQISLVEAMTEAKKVVAEAETARGTTFAESSAPTGATAEAAAELAAENETAAAVAASAADTSADEVEVEVPDEAVEEVPADSGHSVAEDPDAVVPADEPTTETDADAGDADRA